MNHKYYQMSGEKKRYTLLRRGTNGAASAGKPCGPRGNKNRVQCLMGKHNVIKCGQQDGRGHGSSFIC